MIEEAPIDGEVPFNAVERYRLRQLMKNLEPLEPGDVVEIKRIAQSGRLVRGGVVFLVWFLGAVTAVIVFLNAAKQFFGKASP